MAGRTGEEEGNEPLGIYFLSMSICQCSSHQSARPCLAAGSPLHRAAKRGASLVLEGSLKKSLKEKHILCASGKKAMSLLEKHGLLHNRIRVLLLI